MRLSLAWCLALLVAVVTSCGDEQTGAGVEAGIADGSAEAGDALRTDGIVNDPCTEHSCSLDCDPAESYLVLSASSAGDANLIAVGDPAPATPEEVGDGHYHLFVGVYHADYRGCRADRGDAFVHDAVADNPLGPFTLDPEPLFPLAQVEPYERCGVETPSYLRADDHTEYVYYCAQPGPADGRVAALRRRDGGAWEKLGIIAPVSSGQTLHCEQEVVFDAATRRFTMFYMGDTRVADERRFGLFVRTSDRPDAFDASSERQIQEYGTLDSLQGDILTRMSASFDPLDKVWRVGFDARGYVYPPPERLVHSWGSELLPGPATWLANGGVLHEPDDGLHPTLHTGQILAQSRAIYPDPDRVIFYFVGAVQASVDSPLPEEWQIVAQVCRRR